MMIRTPGRRLAVLVGFAAALSVAVAWAKDSPGKGVPAPTQFINEQLANIWKANNLKPSAKANNYEFIRRVYLDLIGRIPRSDEVQTFINKGGNRPELIKKLLYDKDYAREYARNMANLWTVWLLTRSGNPVHHEQMQLWLEEQFERNASYKELVTNLITAKGKTNDNGAVNFI